MIGEEEIGVEDRGLFFLRKCEGRPREQFLFRIRIIDGLPHLCFKDSWNSRRGKHEEVTIPLYLLIEKVHRLLCEGRQSE